MKDGIGSISKRGEEGSRHWRNRTMSHIAPDQVPSSSELIQQGRWANLPPELLLDIIRRVEQSETSWPARSVVVSCASVCRSWRAITKEIIRTPEQCGRLTFPISLKQPGPRESPFQFFIKRDRATSTYLLYFGMVPSEVKKDKLLLAAKRIRRAAGTDFIISLAADDFSRASSTYVGKLRSNFLGTKFSIYDSQPPCDPAAQQNSRSSRRFRSKQVSPRVPAFNYCVGTISYELNVLRTRGPRRMQCIMQTIPVSSIQEGGTAPTPTSFTYSIDDHLSTMSDSMRKGSAKDFSPKTLSEPAVQDLDESLVLKNKAPRWHEQLQCWCLNFRGRVTVASVKNFQLVAAVDQSHNVSVEEQEKSSSEGKIRKCLSLLGRSTQAALLTAEKMAMRLILSPRVVNLRFLHGYFLA
ncbi:Tubby-like F-box protein 5, partial [Cucurbita argyrosperma subsp. sororia]